MFNIYIKKIPMSGFELQTSGNGSDRPTNWARTTAPHLPFPMDTSPQMTTTVVVGGKFVLHAVACFLKPDWSRFWNWLNRFWLPVGPVGVMLSRSGSVLTGLVYQPNSNWASHSTTVCSIIRYLDCQESDQFKALHCFERLYLVEVSIYPYQVKHYFTPSTISVSFKQTNGFAVFRSF